MDSTWWVFYKPHTTNKFAAINKSLDGRLFSKEKTPAGSTQQKHSACLTRSRVRIDRKGETTNQIPALRQWVVLLLFVLRSLFPLNSSLHRKRLNTNRLCFWFSRVSSVSQWTCATLALEYIFFLSFLSRTVNELRAGEEDKKLHFRVRIRLWSEVRWRRSGQTKSREISRRISCEDENNSDSGKVKHLFVVVQFDCSKITR